MKIKTKTKTRIIQYERMKRMNGKKDRMTDKKRSSKSKLHESIEWVKYKYKFLLLLVFSLESSRSCKKHHHQCH